MFSLSKRVRKQIRHLARRMIATGWRTQCLEIEVVGLPGVRLSWVNNGGGSHAIAFSVPAGFRFPGDD